MFATATFVGSKLLQIRQQFLTISPRTFWWFVYAAFNRVDEERLREVGPDRICAEWILRNGGTISLADQPDDGSAEQLVTQYNSLPRHRRCQVSGIFARDIAIMNLGFDHLLGCKQVRTVVLDNCAYMENDSLAKLSYVRQSLRHLEIRSCPMVETSGLLTLRSLDRLKTLTVTDVRAVRNLSEIERRLKDSLPQCEFNFK